MPKYPTCSFCGKNDSKPSREHILHKCFAKEFPTGTWESLNELNNYTRKSTKHLHIVTKPGRAPCEDCNNGWLSRLEKKAKPVLVPLMRGRAKILTPQDQAIIAIWFFARTVMFDLHCETATPRTCYFEDSEHSLLRKSLTCDPYYQFFIAAYSEKQAGFMREDQLNVRFAFNDASEPDSDMVRAYAFTFGIEHLVLQVFCVKGVSDSVGYH